MDFYDIHEQTKYKIVISKPKSMEDLSDLFISKDEIETLVGTHRAWLPSSSDTLCIVILRSEVTAAVKRLINKLEASKKKTIPIDDDELLDVLKTGYVSDWTDSNKYGRHGSRFCYAKRYKRKKTKATQGDVRELWRAFAQGFYTRFRTYPPHISTYDRHLTMFTAFQEIVGWRRVRATTTKQQAKFFRQIWDNPKEYI
jgi:hypothetical protein